MKSDIAFIQRKVAPHGGGEMFALRFLGEIKKRGHKITLFAPFCQLFVFGSGRFHQDSNPQTIFFFENAEFCLVLQTGRKKKKL